jgi:hypothetical protein
MTHIEKHQESLPSRRAMREVIQEYMRRDPSLNDEQAWQKYNAELLQLNPVRFANQRPTDEADTETSSV